MDLGNADSLNLDDSILGTDVLVDEEDSLKTLDDFETIIFPVVGEFLRNEGNEEWQIEEWIGRCVAQYKKCSFGKYGDLFTYISKQIFKLSPPPPAIAHYFTKYMPKKNLSNAYSYEQEEDANLYIPQGASEEARKILKDELDYFHASETDEYVVETIGDNLFHWHVEIGGFDAFTNIGKQIMNYNLANEENDTPKASKFSFGSTYKPKASEVQPKIIFELKFPNEFPKKGPLFRLISPRFLASDEIIFNFEDPEEPTLGGLRLSSSGDSDLSLSNSSCKVISNKGFTNALKSSLVKVFKPEKNPLSMSMQFEKKKQWEDMKMSKCFLNLKKNLLKDNRIEVDLNGKGIATSGSFWREYKCIPLANLAGSESSASAGGKIFLPPSALSEMMESYQHGGRGGYGFGLSGSLGKQGPMIFEISGRSGKRSYCGVMEFSSPDGCVGVPSWMMASLGLRPNSTVQIRRVDLPAGNFVQLQPHYGGDLDNTRVILEWALRRYVALTVGDVIQFEHNHATYTFNVLMCKPNHAIAITDLDISVDFADPLNPSPVSPNEEKSSFFGQKSKLVEPVKQDLSWSYGPLVCDYSSSESEDEAEKLIRENSSVTALGSTNTIDESALEGIDYNQCPNCRQKISTTSFWHYDRCVRLVFYCEMCSESFPKAQYDQHMESFHTATACPQCKEQMEKRSLTWHMNDECKMREVICAFCEIKLVHKNKWEHESRCGAITEICPTCKVRITRVELIKHSPICTGDPSAYKKPNYRANNTQRFDLGGDYGGQKEQYSSEAFKCEHCKMPFEQFDDLEVHMLTDHADKMDFM
jgi:hypothetical protein